MSTPLKTVIKRNVQRLMETHPGMETPGKLQRYCFWPSGKKKGKPISPRNIAYVLDDSDESPSPSIAAIEGIAQAFKVRPWTLLIEIERDRDLLMQQIFGSAASDKRVGEFIPPASSAPPSSNHRHKKHR